MADLMSAQVILGAIRRHKEQVAPAEEDSGVITGYRMAYDHIAELITRTIPTVDAVEVVRCKDCVSWGKPDKCGNGACKMLGCLMRANDFCSYAERKDNGNT